MKLMSADDETSKVLHWLSGRNQLPKHQNQCNRRVTGTGGWLLNDESYLKWKAEPGQILWLSGIGKPLAICGLSILSFTRSWKWKDCLMVSLRLSWSCPEAKSKHLRHKFRD